jgi:phosphoribosylanthranilate isomerase
MSLLVKICGLRTPETLDAALDAGADAVGFVFFLASPRNISFDEARALGARVNGRALKVALSVDADDALLEQIVEALSPDLLQFHGSETPARVAAVQQRFGIPVMKVLPVAEAADLAVVPAYAAIADRIMFDARPPRDATRPGGLGKPFDWHVLEKLDVPFMLSGGLDASNVAEALAITHAAGIDVSSGVERAPGEKDAQKIRDFIRAARAAARFSSPLPLGERSTEHSEVG